MAWTEVTRRKYRRSGLRYASHLTDAEWALNAGVIDSQSVKTTESGGLRGFDTGKKIKGRKRHIVTDTQGNLVGVVVHETDIQDRDGTPRVLASIRSLYPWLRHIFADGGYAGDKLRICALSLRCDINFRLALGAPSGRG